MTVIAKIIAAIQEHGPMTSAQLQEKLPAIDYLSTALSQGARRGQLKKSGAFRKAVYSIGNGKPPKSAPPPGPKVTARGEESRAAQDQRRAPADRRASAGVPCRPHQRPPRRADPRRRAAGLFRRADFRDRGPDARQLRRIVIR